MNATIDVLPAGVVVASAGSLSVGWLECNGQAVNRTTYATLFSAISTTYGVGDGSTTFNLPDMARSVIMGRGGSGTGTIGSTIGSVGGAETHVLTLTEIPAHTHTYTRKVPHTVPVSNTSSGAAPSQDDFASTDSGSAGSDGAHNNVQPSVVMIYQIKY